jgi:hypothetical protein
MPPIDDQAPDLSRFRLVQEVPAPGPLYIMTPQAGEVLVEAAAYCEGSVDFVLAFDGQDVFVGSVRGTGIHPIFAHHLVRLEPGSCHTASFRTTGTWDTTICRLRLYEARD